MSFYRAILLFLALFTPSSAFAGKLNNLRLLDVDQMYVEYKRYKSVRDPYFPEDKYQFRDGGAFVNDLRLLEYLYWHNRLHFDSDAYTNQIKHVGWEYEWGVDFGRAQVGYYHHSRHCTECQDGQRFPVEDAGILRLHFVEPGKAYR